MKLFRRKSREWCVEAADQIYDHLAEDITSISHPVQGSITFKSLEEANAILRHLEARIDEHDGIKRKNPIRRKTIIGVSPW